jgi:hypothetical protein
MSAHAARKRVSAATLPVLLLLLSLPLNAPAAQGPAGGTAAESLAVAGDPGPTPAEQTGLEISPTWEETIAYLREVVATCAHVELSSFGYSVEGRPLPLVLVRERGLDEAEAHYPKPVVMIVAGIHSGEICGNDAIQLLLRDIARGREPEIVANLELVIVPIFNLDGHTRRGPYHRFTQVGPADGFGTRRNATRLDLNRDFTKLETPECQALVRLGSQFEPMIFIDLHTNDGFDHQYDLLFGGQPDPTLPGGRDAMVRGELFPEIVAAMAADGYRSHPIGHPVNELDLTAGLATYGTAAHLATGYFETRQAISLLSEAHPYVSYARRVRATYSFLKAVLRFAARNRIELIETISEARGETLQWALEPGVHEIALGCRADKEWSRPILWLGKALEIVHSPVTGRDYPRYDETPVTYELPFFEQLVPERTTIMPRGYLMERAWGDVARRLRQHSIEVEVLTQPFDGQVEVYHATSVRFARSPQQGHHPIEAIDFAVSTEMRTFPAGSYWIPLDQPAGITAMHLLEPRAPQGLLTWNAFDTIFERGIITEDWALEERALSLLADPEIRADYEAALQDSLFATDPDARLEFFFERSPYLEEEENLYPVYRLMQPATPRTGG